MKPSLQIKLSQQLAMTPQLQQAIRLLQLSSIELQQTIQQALEENPLLELDEQYAEVAVNADTEDKLDSSEHLLQSELPHEMPLDATEDDIYTAGTPSGTYSDYHQTAELPVYQGETTESLQDYLTWQLELTPFSEQDHAIAVAIIEALDEHGYLSVSTQQILEEVGLAELELAEVEAVLKRIQQFDPVGVAARNLSECLLLQLQQLADSPVVAVAKTIIQQYLDRLAHHDFRHLKQLLQVDETTLKQAVELIQHLHPYPGEMIAGKAPQYIIPDVEVRKFQQQWRVLLNTDNLPKLTINQHYANLVQCNNQTDHQFIRHQLQHAHWLLRSLEMRNQTLYKVAQYIVEQQQAFFEHGATAMKPMSLADVAQAINMHESTISRITTQKYLQCNQGVFELKYFFSSRLATERGGEASSTAIQARIKQLIAQEDSQKPLSDSKLVKLLAEQGLIVARRTVAKYRENLAIPPSNLRKQLQ